jgi:hypothetical protein
VNNELNAELPRMKEVKAKATTSGKIKSILLSFLTLLSFTTK